MQQQNLHFQQYQQRSATNLNAYNLSQQRIQEIAERLNQHMTSTKNFLRYRLTVQLLADDIQVQAYQLSAYLNQEKHLRFTDYLNQLRIEYCTGLIRGGMVKDFNMKGLALICGFQNRNTLTLAFKKFTGITPSCYIKSVRLGLQS
jgi:YesN/AraC family two-component response regulator